MFAFTPRKELKLSSPLPPEELLKRLAAATEPSEGFPLRSKLSGAGIVVRVLHPPPTTRPLFGRVGADGFKVACVPDPANQGPFQPIAEANVSESGAGSLVSLTLRPHKQVKSYSPLFAGMAVILFLVAGVTFRDSGGIGLIAAVFGGLFLVFPRFRATHGFEQGCVGLEKQLRGLLEHE